MTKTDSKGTSMNSIATLGLLLSVTLLVACQDKVAQTNPETQKPALAQTSTDYPGKPTAPVRIGYQLSKNIQLGLPLVVSLSITPLVNAQHISLHYQIEGAMTSGDPQTQFDFGNTPAGTTLQQDINVIPQAEGSHRIIVTVRIEADGGHSGSRSMSIPIVLGNPAQTTLKPQGTTSTDPQGKPIIVMPAQEEVIKH